MQAQVPARCSTASGMLVAMMCPRPLHEIRRHSRAWRVLGAAAGLCLGLLHGCSSFTSPASLPAGLPVDQVQQRLGPPREVYPRADGSQRLAYPTGPFGRQAWMVDIDPQGRLVRAENVLTEASFARVQPGMTTQQVREALGPPGRVWAVRYHDQTVWSYRYETPFCQVFHVGLTPQGLVEDTSFGPDPLCERDDLPALRLR